MIKVRPIKNLPRINPIKSILDFSFCHFVRRKRHDDQFVNFSTDDFLGINKKYKNQNSKQKLPDNMVFAALESIFDRPISYFDDEAGMHQSILAEIVGREDIIVLDDFVNTNLKLAVKHVAQDNILILKHSNYENLEGLAETHKYSGRKIWFVAQSIYPVPGTIEALKSIHQLLEKHDNLFFYVDDSYGLSWTGRKGCGLGNETLPDLKKTILTASLTKGFGAEKGAIAITEMVKLNFTKLSARNLLRGNASAFYRSLELHNTHEIGLLQAQLKEKVNYYHTLVKGQLPCISNPHLPVSFLTVGLPEVCHEICYGMVKKGFYVSSAVFPHANIKQPGIKVNINIGHSKEQIANLVDELKDAYAMSLKKRNKKITELFEIQQT